MQLREEVMAADASLGMCLGCLELGESMLSEVDWFTFPESVRLKSAVAALRALKEAAAELEPERVGSGAEEEG